MMAAIGTDGHTPPYASCGHDRNRRARIACHALRRLRDHRMAAAPRNTGAVMKLSRTILTGGAFLLVAACGSGSADTSPIAVVAALPTPMPTPTSATATSAPTPGATIAGVIVQAGDSIGVGQTAGDYAAIDHLGLADVEVHNASVSGQWMLSSYGARSTELFPFCNRARTCALLIQDGTNDLRGGTSANNLYRNVLTPFVAAARLAGFYVAVDTILPRGDTGWTAALEAQRLAYNNLVRANAAGADAVNDIAADATIGDGSNPAASIYYSDGLHPTLLGQQRLAVLDATALEPLLKYPARR
jgi:hypothetical protein